MKRFMFVMGVALTGCVAAPVTDVRATLPIMSLQMRGEPQEAAKCVVIAINALKMGAAVRDLGAEVQVLWEPQPFGTPLGLFSLRKSAAGPGSAVEIRMGAVQDLESYRKGWMRALQACA